MEKIISMIIMLTSFLVTTFIPYHMLKPHLIPLNRICADRQKVRKFELNGYTRYEFLCRGKIMMVVECKSLNECVKIVEIDFSKKEKSK